MENGHRLLGPKLESQSQIISPTDMDKALNELVSDSLPSVAAGLSALYFILSVSHIFLLPGNSAYIMSSVSLTTALGLVFLHAVIKGQRISSRWSHLIATGIVTAVLLNSLLHIYLIPDPKQTVNLMLLTIGIGCVFLSNKWFALNIGLVDSGYIFTAWSYHDLPEWLHFAFGIFMATVLSIIVFVIRMRVFQRLIGLNLSGNQEQEKLTIALADLNVARKAAEDSAHKLQQALDAERKKDKALRESERRYRDLVENSEGLICAHDLQGNVLSINPAASRSLGYRQEDLVGRNVREALIPSAQLLFDNYLEEIRQEKKHSGIMRVKAVDGTERIWLYHNSLYEPTEGDSYVLGHAQDITARHHLESLLRGQNHILKMLLSGVSLTDLLINICRYVENHTLSKMCIALLSTETGLRLLPIEYPKVPDSCIKKIEETVSKIETNGAEIEVYDLTKDDRFSDCRDEALNHGLTGCKIISLASSKGDRLGKLLIWFGGDSSAPSSNDQIVFQNAAQLASLAIERKQTDKSLQQAYETLEVRVHQRTEELKEVNEALRLEIAERQCIEESLRASEARFAGILKMAEEAIISVDTDQRIVVFNRGAEQIFGYKAESVMGQPLDILLPARFVGKHHHYIGEFSTGPDIARGMAEKRKIKGRRADGLEFPAEASISKLVLNYEETFTVILRDITERERADEELQRTISLLRATLESTADGILVVDINNQILQFNRKFIEMWKLPESVVQEKDNKKALAFAMNQLKDPTKAINKVHQLYNEPEAVSFDILELKDGRIFERFSQPQKVSNRSVGRVWSFRDITDRRKAEEEMLESEARFRVTFEQAAVGMAHVGLDGKYLLVNQKLCSILGYSSYELSRLTFQDVTYSDDLPKGLSMFEQALAGVIQEFNTEKRYIRKDGRVIWGSVTVTLVLDESRRPKYFVVVIEDINNRKLIEEALQQSEQEYRSLFEQAHDAIIIFSPDNEIVLEVNQRACDIYGFPRSEFIGKSLEDITMNISDGKARIGETLSQKEYKNFETVQYRKDLSEMFLEINAALISYKGQPAILSINRDITQRKHIEEAMRESEEKYRALYEDNPSIYLTFDAQGTVLSVNRYGIEHLGYEREELVGKSVLNIVHPEDKETIRRKLKSWLGSPEKRDEVEFRKLRKDGSVIWLREYVRVVYNQQKEPIVLVVCEDISEQKKAETELGLQNNYLGALHETTIGLLNRLTLDELLEDIVTRACELVKIPNGFVYLVEPDGKKMKVQVATGYGQQFIGRLVVLGEGVAGKVWQTGNSLVINDYSNWSDRAKEDGYERLYTVAGMPLESGGEVIGVLGVESLDATVEFGGAELEILSRFAQLASVALDNATLYKALQEELVERSELEAAVRKSAIEWRNTFDAIESLIVITDLSGKIMRLNQATKEVLNKSYNDILGRSIETLCEGEPWQKARELVEEVSKARTSLSLQTEDKSTGKTWDMAGHIFLLPEFQEDRIIIVIREITAMIALQESLRKSEMVYSMGKIVAGVAHEVRNPLFGISATLDAFEETLNTYEEFFQTKDEGLEIQRENTEYISSLREGVDQLNSLMEELLEYGKPPIFDISECNLDDILTESIKVVSPIAKQLRVGIQFTPSANLKSLFWDRKRMLQVFRNLIENAIQHSPAGSSVTIIREEITCDDGDWLECRIEDCGPGFRLDDIPRIFDPFFTRRRGGTGLGLSIAYRVVGEHKGKIFAANRNGGGAVVTVRVPVNE